tara:strand:- start:852 stop:1112 length:261 start_codon:yes stop_codon:yes gene_type:complete
MYIKMTQRAFNSPTIKYANFKDGTFINLIKLKKPYANGTKYAVYETTKSPFCSNGFYKTIEEANKKFELMILNGSKCSDLIIKETI